MRSVLPAVAVQVCSMSDSGTARALTSNAPPATADARLGSLAATERRALTRLLERMLASPPL